MNKEELISEIKSMYYSDQKFRRVNSLIQQIDDPNNDSFPGRNKSEKGRLVTKTIYKGIIEKQDSINTERLLEITKEYGFPGMYNLNHDIPIFLVFVHSKEKYFDEIRSLIEFEFQKNHISKFEKDYIFWHLNKREGMLPRNKKPINYRTDEAIINGV